MWFLFEGVAVHHSCFHWSKSRFSVSLCLCVAWGFIILIPDSLHILMPKNLIIYPYFLKTPPSPNICFFVVFFVFFPSVLHFFLSSSSFTIEALGLICVDRWSGNLINEPGPFVIPACPPKCHCVRRFAPCSCGGNNKSNNKMCVVTSELTLNAHGEQSARPAVVPNMWSGGL